jgi:hypothetical protein
MIELGEQILEMLVIIHYENCYYPAWFKKHRPSGYAKTLLLPVVFMRETWYLTLRKE